MIFKLSLCGIEIDRKLKRYTYVTLKSNKERRDRYRRVEGIWVRSHKTNRDKATTLRRKWSLFLEPKSCFKVN